MVCAAPQPWEFVLWGGRRGEAGTSQGLEALWYLLLFVVVRFFLVI
jgi:hypothetical protein